MAKKVQAPTQPEKTVLVADLAQAQQMIVERIEAGNAIKEMSVSTADDFEKKKADFSRWDDYNKELLKQLFNTADIVQEYSIVGNATHMENIYSPTHFSVKANQYNERTQRKTDKLISIKERLPLLSPSPIQLNSPQQVARRMESKTKVFVVHGHNDEVKQTIARVIEKLGLEAVILHEQANAGMTVIEKLEAHSDVDFAVVLLTPDDEGKSKKAGDVLKDRARQNVIAELGYFVGKLGRSKVCPLFLKDVEIPSDFNGVTYVQIDDSGMWKFALARELKNAGFDIDMNNIPM